MAENGTDTLVRPRRREVRQDEGSHDDNADKWREDLREQIRQNQGDELGKSSLRDRIRKFFANRQTEASSVRTETRKRLMGHPSAEMRKERRDAQKAIVELFVGIEEGIVRIEDEKSLALINNLRQELGEAGITASNAALIYPIIEYALKAGPTANGLKSQMQEVAGLIAGTDEVTLNKLTQAILNTARSGHLDVTEDEAREMFTFKTAETEDEPPELFRSRQWEVIKNYIGQDPKDREVIYAIFSARKLGEYVANIRSNPVKYGGSKFEEIHRKFQSDPNQLNTDAYWVEISEIVEHDITAVFGKLFRRLASAHKSKFMDEIANENQMESINVAKTHMLQGLTNLSNAIANMNDEARQANGLDGLRLRSKRVRKYLEEKIIDYKDENGAEKTHRVLQDRRIAVSNRTEVDLSEFLGGVQFQVERFVDNVLPYNHNVQALFLRGAGQDGTFWGQIGGYAAQHLSTFDLDALNDIPDSDIVLAAMRLYSKYVKADFAFFDWNNRTGRFTEDFDSPNSPIQQDVIKKMKQLFPDLADIHNKWRLDQAMNIAIGASRGIF